VKGTVISLSSDIEIMSKLIDGLMCLIGNSTRME
jgi:hypothetical protein